MLLCYWLHITAKHGGEEVKKEESERGLPEEWEGGSSLTQTVDNIIPFNSQGALMQCSSMKRVWWNWGLWTL